MHDPLFNDPRLAKIYDSVESDRSDLDGYAEIVDELGARSVLDIGCGTGTFACMLASKGIDVVGVDPAAASLEVARLKPPANSVRWLFGDATMLPPLRVDLATMTGNVAQVFLTDTEWTSCLRGIYEALRPGGRLVFEARDPDRMAWLEWTRDQTYCRINISGSDVVEYWCDLLSVDPPLLTFRQSYAFGSDGVTIASDSTLRFRGRDEITNSLTESGFRLDEVRGAADRPGEEFVFLATRVD